MMMGTNTGKNQYVIGDSFDTELRTITDTDIINFAGLSGDFNALHVNDLFAARSSPFGKRIAHGQLIASIVTGLGSQLDEWPILSYIGASRRFTAAVMAGDTIFGRYTISECRASRSKPGKSIVKLALDVINQDDTIVISGEDTMLVIDPKPASMAVENTSRIYFDDIVESHQFGTSRRSITEADIIWFSGISGDHSPLHTDKTFIEKNTGFGDRIAQGWLIVGIQSGLRSELMRWEILAYLEAERQFAVPAYPGDTIEAMYKVAKVKRSKSKPDRGVVHLSCQVINQNGDVVQEGSEVFLVATQP
jgi:3-hydroxybutyryl-CoA dehydratase